MCCLTGDVLFYKVIGHNLSDLSCAVWQVTCCLIGHNLSDLLCAAWQVTCCLIGHNLSDLSCAAWQVTCCLIGHNLSELSCAAWQVTCCLIGHNLSGLSSTAWQVTCMMPYRSHTLWPVMCCLTGYVLPYRSKSVWSVMCCLTGQLLSDLSSAAWQANCCMTRHALLGRSQTVGPVMWCRLCLVLYRSRVVWMTRSVLSDTLNTAGQVIVKQGKRLDKQLLSCFYSAGWLWIFYFFLSKFLTSLKCGWYSISSSSPPFPLLHKFCLVRGVILTVWWDLPEREWDLSESSERLTVYHVCPI
jgi:hypothetical protein